MAALAAAPRFNPSVIQVEAETGGVNPERSRPPGSPSRGCPRVIAALPYPYLAWPVSAAAWTWLRLWPPHPAVLLALREGARGAGLPLGGSDEEVRGSATPRAGSTCRRPWGAASGDREAREGRQQPIPAGAEDERSQWLQGGRGHGGLAPLLLFSPLPSPVGGTRSYTSGSGGGAGAPAAVGGGQCGVVS